MGNQTSGVGATVGGGVGAAVGAYGGAVLGKYLGEWVEGTFGKIFGGSDTTQAFVAYRYQDNESQTYAISDGEWIRGPGNSDRIRAMYKAAGGTSSDPNAAFAHDGGMQYIPQGFRGSVFINGIPYDAARLGLDARGMRYLVKAENVYVENARDITEQEAIHIGLTKKGPLGEVAGEDLNKYLPYAIGAALFFLFRS